LQAPDADTPWGKLQRGLLSVQFYPSPGSTVSRGELKLRASHAQTPWAAATNLALTLRLSPGEATNVVRADLDLAAARVETKWGRSADARFTAQWIHSFTNAIPLSGRGELRLDNAETPWGKTRELQLGGSLSIPTNAPAQTDPTWAWWTNLAPFALEMECRLAGLQSPRLEADRLSCSGRWSAPRLTLSRLSGKLYGGSLDAQASLNAATREFQFAGSSDFDAHKISPLLTEKSRAWLAQFSWEKPPVVKARGALILPVWTNRQPD
jgi:hypothetical protein